MLYEFFWIIKKEITSLEFHPWLNSGLKPHGIDAMTQDDQKKFISDVIDLYCKEYNPGKDGKIEYRCKGLHFTGHK